jgi:hypothetical protein
MAENENQQYMQNFWYNDSFVFMILVLKCHLWLDKGLDEESEGSKYSVWFGSGGWEGSIGWGWWNKFSVLSSKQKIKKIIPLLICFYDFSIEMPPMARQRA